MSSLGGLAIDSDNEDAQFISRNYSGLDQIIDRLKDDTGAAAGMTPSKLWGSSQKTALSNSSEGDKYEWADCVDDWRGEAIDEPATDFFKLVFLAKNGPTSGRLPDSWNLKYASALRLTLKEQSELRKTAAETDKINVVDVKSLLPEEVRESAFGGSEYTIERTLQPDLWAKRQAEAEQQQSEEAYQEPDEGEVDEDGNPLEEEGSDVTVTDSGNIRTDDATPAKRIIDWHGFKLGLQYQPFDLRHGKVLPVAYGHIQKTKGADGMACDCYVGPDLESDRVFEITQLVNGQFDEHKYMLGFASQDAARNTFLKVMPAAMFGGIREVGLSGLEPYRLDGGSEDSSPKAPSGGTSRTDADNPILSSVDRADKQLRGLEDGAIERVNSALESSYQALEAQILRRYSLETPGSLMAGDRAAVLLSQVADLLGLINTRNAEEIQQAFEDLLRGADAQGATLADNLARAIANQQLQMTANVPLAAILNQATEGMTRLRNHTEAFADKASTVVTQGLIQGWGTDKIASLLQKEMGLVRHKAETIARTESLSATNAAAKANYQANGLMLGSWQATADDRLCPTCGARNQKVYKLQDIVIPAHPRCRCFITPMSQTWLDLGLVDTTWAADFRARSLAELESLGLEPDYGRSAFEKANGLELPQPVWEPGQKLDSLNLDEGESFDEWREDAGIPVAKAGSRLGANAPKVFHLNMLPPTPLILNTRRIRRRLQHMVPAVAVQRQQLQLKPLRRRPLRKRQHLLLLALQQLQPAPAKKTTAKKTAKKAATPTPQPSASPVKLNQTELTSKRADLEKRFGKQLVADAESNVKKVLDQADVFVRVGSADTLEKVLGGGFKTSAELNVTSHQIPNLADKNYQDARNRVEAKTLGYDEKTTQPGDRPIYGYLGGSDLNGQAHADVSRAYGSIAVKLKSDVKDRTSFTGADSFKSGIASEVNNPNAASLVSLTRHGYDRDKLPAHYPSYMKGDQNDQSALQNAARAKSIDDLAPKLAPTGNAYMEAQVHGGVKPSDIAELHFSPSGASDRPNAAIAQFAKDNQVSVFVDGKKLSAKDLDNIITPPAKTTLHDLSDALDKGDLQGIFSHVDAIATQAASVKLNPGSVISISRRCIKSPDTTISPP
jgi:SPP1 gp7 family putative phage head morphogenesis protein